MSRAIVVNQSDSGTYINLTIKAIQDAACNVGLRRGVSVALSGHLLPQIQSRIANAGGPLYNSANIQTVMDDPPFDVSGKVTMMSGGKQLPHAWMEEEGSDGLPGGVISPRPENPIQRLVWRDPVSGELIFARQVYHRGKHYMANGARAAAPGAYLAIVQEIAVETRKVLK